MGLHIAAAAAGGYATTVELDPRQRTRHGRGVDFRIVGDLRDLEPIAKGAGIRDRERLNKSYGTGRWRKLKGFAIVRLENGALRNVEFHWYEAHGIGRREMRIKRYL